MLDKTDVDHSSTDGRMRIGEWELKIWPSAALRPNHNISSPSWFFMELLDNRYFTTVSLTTIAFDYWLVVNEADWWCDKLDPDASFPNT